MQAAKRVAKNTGILYVRMAITVFISLYSTRLVLAALGVADFGLFNVVGGVISMLGFLNASMAAATQRFMSFAQGSGDFEKVKRIFNMSTLLHWGIAVVIFLVLEVIGYFFFDGVLNIAAERRGVAKLIYQFMVISTLFTVISVPYEAVITSHENMMVYAVLGVLEAVLKLGIAFYITYSNQDHLIVYGLLMALLAIFLLIIKRIYCHKHYQECDLRIKYYYDKPLLKEMGGFAGWSLLGSSSSMIALYGQGILLNIFFGTIVNAAQAVANQISGQLSVLSTVMRQALNPLINKSEGSGNRTLVLNTSFVGSKISFFLLMVTFVPVIIEMPFIFRIWLSNVPEYAIIFCRLILFRNLIEQTYITLMSAISAVGEVKSYNITISFLNVLPLSLNYYLFLKGFSPISLYISTLIYSIIKASVVIYYAKIKCGLSIKLYLNDVVLICLSCFLIVFILNMPIYYFLQSGLIRILLIIILSTLFSLATIWFLGFSKIHRKMLLDFIVININKIKKLNC
jgi:O-antigen/teichoic acid export membrane protein